jgi:hypothetical protein
MPAESQKTCGLKFEGADRLLHICDEPEFHSDATPHYCKQHNMIEAALTSEDHRGQNDYHRCKARPQNRAVSEEA